MKNLKNKMMKALIAGLTIGALSAGTLSIGTVSAQAASIEPSQAFSEALKTADSIIRDKYGLSSFRLYKVNQLSIGKYAVGEFGDYSLSLNYFKDAESYKCAAMLSIQKVPFAMQGANVRILEQVINDYQIIAKYFEVYIDCKK